MNKNTDEVINLITLHFDKIFMDRGCILVNLDLLYFTNKYRK